VQPEDHVRQWLTSNQTGCAFATLLAKAKRGIAMAPFPAIAAPEDLNSLLDFAAADRLPAIAVLPGVRTELDAAQQLLALATSERWHVCRVRAPQALDTNDVFVSLEWRTPASSGMWSSPMGLGPFGAMPPTRRAPYTCIAAWPGGHDNKFYKRRDAVVHFLDVDLGRYRLDAAKYSLRKTASVAATTAIMGDDKASHYRNVAFRLSPAVASVLAPLPLR
jgi:hypothetical protein